MSFRSSLVALVLRALRVTVRLLSVLVPQSRSVVVSAYPETEGNGVEVARALVETYDGKVVWLREAGPIPPDVAALADRGMVLAPKVGFRGVGAYLRAEAVLFTHGLYGSPAPVRRKPLVNLWHGDGPKDVRPDNGVGGLIASTWFVGSTRLFSEHQAAGFDVRPEHVLLTGNPRTDQLWRPPDPAGLAALGITGDFVIWMPTFRRARAVGAMRAQSELRGNATRSEDAHLDALLETGRAWPPAGHQAAPDGCRGPAAARCRHSDRRRPAGRRCHALRPAGTCAWTGHRLLQCLGRLPAHRPADGLPRGRPRRLHPQAGPAGRPRLGARPAAVATRIGLNPTRTSAQDLVSALAERQVLRCSPARLPDSAGTAAPGSDSSSP
jgi:hypothetical protein